MSATSATDASRADGTVGPMVGGIPLAMSVKDLMQHKETIQRQAREMMPLIEHPPGTTDAEKWATAVKMVCEIWMILGPQQDSTNVGLTGTERGGG